MEIATPPVAAATKVVDELTAPPAPKKKKKTVTFARIAYAPPTGGDMDDCLDSDDIDALVLPIAPEGRYLKATTLYEARIGVTPHRECGAAIKDLCVKAGAEVAAAVHVRHHWAMAAFSVRNDGTLVARVFDSAPSPVTKEDIFKLMKGMEVADVCFPPAWKQPRYSNDCGLHAVIHAWRILLGTTKPEGGVISLTHLRGTFKELANDPHGVRRRARGIAAAPAAPAGGAPPARDVRNTARNLGRSPEEIDEILRRGDEAQQARQAARASESATCGK
jgi:hypothetical protein